ncbi:MAG: enoyl-CoA hydratase [Myxococcota bacterium]
MSQPDGSTVLYEVGDGIATITMNRPEARNALSRALQRDLSAAFARADADDEVRVVILTGAGVAFTAGVDLKEFGETGGQNDGERADIWAAMSACSKPIVGAINGPAITGGFEVALACDVLIAGRSARFADTHGRVGVLPGAGLSQRLSRAIGIYRAKYLSLTGNFLDGETAMEWGLVSHVVEDDALMDTARQVARDMLGLQPHMLPAMKKVIDDGFAMTFGEAMPMESKRSRAQIQDADAWRGAGAAFEGVRERGRSQNE